MPLKVDPNLVQSAGYKVFATPPSVHDLSMMTHTIKHNTEVKKQTLV